MWSPWRLALLHCSCLDACLAAYSNFLRRDLNTTCITINRGMGRHGRGPIRGGLMNMETLKQAFRKSWDKNHMRGDRHHDTSLTVEVVWRTKFWERSAACKEYVRRSNPAMEKQLVLSTSTWVSSKQMTSIFCLSAMELMTSRLAADRPSTFNCMIRKAGPMARKSSPVSVRSFLAPWPGS